MEALIANVPFKEHIQINKKGHTQITKKGQDVTCSN